MGMFDYVDYEAPCGKCGEMIREFQSKDGPCLLKHISPRKVRRFYQTCAKCGEWNEFKVKVETYRVKRVKPPREGEVG